MMKFISMVDACQSHATLSPPLQHFTVSRGEKNTMKMIIPISVIWDSIDNRINICHMRIVNLSAK